MMGTGGNKEWKGKLRSFQGLLEVNLLTPSFPSLPLCFLSHPFLIFQNNSSSHPSLVTRSTSASNLFLGGARDWHPECFCLHTYMDELEMISLDSPVLLSLLFTCIFFLSTNKIGFREEFWCQDHLQDCRLQPQFRSQSLPRLKLGRTRAELKSCMQDYGTEQYSTTPTGCFFFPSPFYI